MSKKIVGFVVFVVLIVAVVGGVFWWMNYRVVVGSVADYVVKGQIISNEKAGLSFDVPAGWIVEKIDELEGSVIVYSPDTEFIEAKTVPLKKGCLIGVGIVYKKMDFEELKEEINDIHYGLGVKSEEFETITINNTQSLKNTFDTVFMGKGTSIYIPNDNKFYSFAAYAEQNDETQCLKDFDEFLNKVSYE